MPLFSLLCSGFSGGEGNGDRGGDEVVGEVGADIPVEGSGRGKYAQTNKLGLTSISLRRRLNHLFVNLNQNDCFVQCDAFSGALMIKVALRIGLEG